MSTGGRLAFELLSLLVSAASAYLIQLFLGLIQLFLGRWY